MAGPLGYSGGTFAIPPLEIALAPLQAYLVPSGEYELMLGRYSSLEWFDSNINNWRATGVWAGSHIFSSDGGNFRLINRTGGPMGAVMTNLGTGYTTTPAVAASAGNSVWLAVVGGALNTTVTVTTAGLFNYPPTIIFPPAPDGGVTATATATLSAGAIASVSMNNRGAGYIVAPVGTINTTAVNLSQVMANQGNSIIVCQDPRDTAAGGASLTINATLAGSQVVTGILCLDPGNTALTSLPTLTISGGGGASAAATVIMNWTVTGFTVGTAGVAYGNAQPFTVTGSGLVCQTAAASGDTNPQLNVGLTKPRNFLISGTSTAGGAVTATGISIDDAGWGIQQVPNGLIVAGGGALPTTAGAVTMTVGGITDVNYLQMRKL